MENGKNKVLLVEGVDDKHVVTHLCVHHGIPESFGIKQLDGIALLLKNLPVEIKGSDVEVIGILVDANADTQGRWDSLRDRLEAASYPSVPASPVDGGFIAEPPPNTLLPRVGIWVMPDNSTGGTLEDFLRLLVKEENRPLLEHAQNSIDNIPDGQRLFGANDDTKALLHTWLAWQAEPGRPFGTAIKARYLDADLPEAVAFVDWLRRLFS